MPQAPLRESRNIPRCYVGPPAVCEPAEPPVIEVAAIITMTLATIAAIATRFAPRLAPRRLIFDLTPDHPHAFGYRMAWLAIRTRDTQRVIDALRLEHVEPANWNTGLGTVYAPEYEETHLFISPPVDGWTFVIGLPLPHPLGRTFADKSMPLLLELGGQFAEVQYFFAYPPIDLFGWARVIDGRLVRAFAMGDEGQLWSKGRATKEEKALDIKLFELRGVKGRKGDAGGEIVLHPTEEHVIRLAGRWSIDPTRIDTIPAGPALGYIAHAPLRWRPERQRKLAA